MHSFANLSVLSVVSNQHADAATQQTIMMFCGWKKENRGERERENGVGGW
jgi:hypothetical protein